MTFCVAPLQTFEKPLPSFNLNRMGMACMTAGVPLTQSMFLGGLRFKEVLHCHDHSVAAQERLSKQMSNLQCGNVTLET